MHVWLILLSIAGVAGVALLFFLASKSAKNEQTWEKLDNSDTASANPGQAIGGRRAKRKFRKHQQPPTAAGEPNLETGLKQKPPHTAWEDSSYCWVVVCKNHWVHRRPNIFHVHRIPLVETDAVTPRPKIDRPILVRCDLCLKEYAYKPSEVLRYEQEVPESFTPHPLFRVED
jgi:hypothetical protein